MKHLNEQEKFNLNKAEEDTDKKSTTEGLLEAIMLRISQHKDQLTYFCMYVSLFGICAQYSWRNKLKLEKKIVQKREKLIDEIEIKFYQPCNIYI